MRKIIYGLLSALFLVVSLCGCAGANSAASEGKLSIVTTIFPEYDWVREILGSNPKGAEVTLLLDDGVDLHSFQPTADDIVKISSCDVFVYVGGESDEWVDDALKEATNKDMIVINLLDVLGDGAKEEEIIEGMEAEEEEEGAEGEEEEIEYDEHVWLSLNNAKILVEKIAKAIESADKDNAATYEANAKEYISKLDDLDGKYREAVSGASCSTLLFGDRFPFRYLVDDYGLNYYAAFVGCSAETEASFETVAFLAGKVDELSLKNIMTIEKSDGKIASTIRDNTTSKDQQVLALDSMQSTTMEDIQNGSTYLGVMKNNFEVLKKALN
jgi:zinc transport system substrate-binding protein